jgi:large subunit ribosomal protein L25
MSEITTLVAEIRGDEGKGASRRLRRLGKVPAILYGGQRDPVSLSLDHDELLHASDKESFYSSVIELNAGEGKTQEVIVRDLQRHPFKLQIMHADFMRVEAGETLRLSVPLHFVGEERSPAGRASGVIIQHQMTEVEITALPRNLPEFIEVDLSTMEPGDAVLLSELVLPDGVEIPALAVSEDNDVPVCNAVHIRESQGTGVAAAEEAEAEAAELLGLEEGEEVEGEEEAEGESEEGEPEED